jgi:hypothetical protein
MKTKIMQLNCDLMIPYISTDAVCHETASADNHVFASCTAKLCFVSESVMVLLLDILVYNVTTASLQLHTSTFGTEMI